ncbi:Eco57I restriction-modification methylase domain-containing protein [Blastopirellula marina]|nr:Eco57I restriction-modification methylase domain-containing protein [Blastopirellula marina]
MDDVEASLDNLATSGIEERGAVFTKPAIVDFILDLTGYQEADRLFEKRFLEPSFGHGSFLLPALRRLLSSWQQSGTSDPGSLESSVFAIELHQDSYEKTRSAVMALLGEFGLARRVAVRLVDHWLVQGDFLLKRIPGQFDFVVGNPPYVRIERIPQTLMREYRARYKTIYDRADLYVPFIERSLDLLSAGGKLGFICADRWMKNRYGGPLRRKVAEGFHVESYIDMNGVDAFSSDVIAYPAITVIRNASPGPTKIVARVSGDESSLKTLGSKLSSGAEVQDDEVATVEVLSDGASPWIMTQCHSSKLLRHLEADFPTIEETGCKVGIGVATGADRVFIAPYDQLDVEEDRKLPLATTKDIANGKVAWQGLGVVNPFADSGKLVELDRYPKLRSYLNARREELCKRHVAQKAPANWYRTIDRIRADLTYTPKLLIPDIKGAANVVAENGQLYPHHNLYFITAGNWDIQALKLVLSTGIAHLFVANYSTKMRGGYLRFQAQHLRRIRLPMWETIAAPLQKELIEAGQSGTLKHGMDLVAKLYDLTKPQRSVLASHAAEAVR